ncbi:hypothetical protein NPIL_406201, partial [Nephila pilipes]
RSCVVLVGKVSHSINIKVLLCDFEHVLCEHLSRSDMTLNYFVVDAPLSSKFQINHPRII